MPKINENNRLFFKNFCNRNYNYLGSLFMIKIVADFFL